MPDRSHNGDGALDGQRVRFSEDQMGAGLHGRAALLLVESLIHSLVDKGVITRGEAIDVIDIASEVEAALAGLPQGEVEGTLLAPLATTFRIEIE